MRLHPRAGTGQALLRPLEQRAPISPLESTPNLLFRTEGRSSYVQRLQQAIDAVCPTGTAVAHAQRRPLRPPSRGRARNPAPSARRWPTYAALERRTSETGHSRLRAMILLARAASLRSPTPESRRVRRSSLQKVTLALIWTVRPSFAPVTFPKFRESAMFVPGFSQRWKLNGLDRSSMSSKPTLSVISVCFPT
jgi:hypothetical protein